MRQHHAQFPGPGHKERNVVGTPMWPGYALRSLGWFAAVAAVLVLMGGLLQINPIFQWGPYETWRSTNGAQPDWYLGWLIGALRLMPALEPRFWGHTWVPNPFWGGALFPLVCFGTMYLWPWLEARFITKDRRRHDLLDRPRDNPLRTAIGAGFFAWVFVVFVAGAADRILVSAGLSYEGQMWVFRVLVVIGPFLVGRVTYRICRELRDTGRHPLRSFSGRTIRRRSDGGFETVAEALQSREGPAATPLADSRTGTTPGEPSTRPDGRTR
jgi:ubiquinol-cytochrome c reductase cytochrome b subunit